MDILKEISLRAEAIRGEMRKGLVVTDRTELDIDEPAGFLNSSSFVFGEIPPKYKSREYLQAAMGWVYACASAIADGVAKIDIKLYEIDKDNEVAEVDSHQSLDLLYQVNRFTTKFDHFWQTQQYLELAGEAPWFVDRGESGKGEPQNILLLRPDRMDIRKSEKENEPPIAGYIYRTDYGKRIPIEFNELIFLKYPDPLNSFRGKGTLQAAAVTVDVDNYAEEYNRRFFFNSARPDSLLTTDQKLTERQRQTLKQDIRKIYQGKENAHKTAILEQGLDWKPMTFTPKDMEFLNQQKFSMMKILSIFRTPKPIVAVSDDVNLANAKVAEYVFAKWTIVPKIERIISQLNEFYLPMFSGTENMFLAYTDPTPAEIELDLKRYDSGLGRGYMTINEVRREQNYDDIGEEGDKIYLPAGVVPIEMAGQIQAGPAQYSIKLKNKPTNKQQKLNDIIRRSAGGYYLALKRLHVKEKSKDKQVQATKKIEEIESKINQIAASMVEKIIQAKSKHVKSQKNGQTEPKKREQKIVDFTNAYLKAADKYEKDFKKTISAQFGRQKDKILNQAPKKDINIDDFLLDESDETQILAEVSSPLMKDIIKDQGDRAGLLVGQGEGAFDAMTARVRAFIKNRTLRFSFEMTKETNRLLKNTLNDGIKEGEGIPELRKRVESLFDDMDKYRSERIARSEVIRASNFATHEAYEQSGVVEELEWLTTDDEATCEWCGPLDGEHIKLNGSFFDRGDKYRGRDGGLLDIDYESVKHPPLHPNCRCTIIPIIK